MTVKFFKLPTLPGTPVADAFYFIENGSYAESYLTNSSGVAKMIGNSAMIGALISAQLSALNQTHIVADIAARNALTATLNRNAVIQVINATADTTVASGGATYLWDDANGVSIKISEFESMDVVVQWSSIQGKPTSTPAQIDVAVANTHTHTNISVLNGLTDVSGVLNFNGVPVKGWETANW